MTREEAIQFLDNMKHEEAGRAIGNDGFYAELMGHHVEALNIAIKALEHPEQNVIAVVPCGDAISRQAAIDALLEWGTWQERIGRQAVLMCELKQTCADILNDLPNVTPKQRTGHWIDDCSNLDSCENCKYDDGECCRLLYEAKMESEATSGESYNGEFEAMERNGRMDAVENGHD